MRRVLMTAVACGFTLALAATPALAQRDYSRWSDPDTEVKSTTSKADSTARADLKAMVAKIRGLIDKAEKKKAADPNFLKDLRAAIGKHGPYWNARIVSEPFTDGDYTNNPTWTTLMGRFSFNKKQGLMMEPSGTSGQSQGAAQVLSAILGGGSGGAAGNGNPADNVAIALDQSLPNTIAYDVIMRVGAITNAADANMRIGLTQGTNRRSGYWVMIVPGSAPSVSLHAITRNGAKRLAVSHLNQPLREGDVVRVQAQRRSDGRIRVSVNKKRVIDVKDGSFKQAYDGLVLGSGDMSMSVRRVNAYAHK